MSYHLRLRNARRVGAIGLRVIVGRTEGYRFIPAVSRYRDGLDTDTAESASRLIERNSAADRLGIIMGPCRFGNVFALDLDRGHGDGADGVAEMRRWLDSVKLASLPLGPRIKTPRGGFQMIFRAPEGVEVRNMSGRHGLAPGVDVKGRNGLVTIPPTERHDGIYSFVMGYSLFEAEIPEAPSELIEAVQRRVFEPPPHPDVWRASSMLDDAEQARRRRYVETAINSSLYDLERTGSGGRNHQLFRTAATIAAFAAGEPGLVKEGDFVERLRAAAGLNGSTAEDGALAIDNTIFSGFRRGRREPRYAPEPKEKRRALSRTHAA